MWQALLGQGISDTINIPLQAAFAQKNYDMQQRQNDRNQANQETAWEREDTAIQRRMADLQAAGLNPNLAAGSAAQTSAPMKQDAPQFDSSQIKMAENLGPLMEQARMNDVAYEGATIQNKISTEHALQAKNDTELSNLRLAEEQSRSKYGYGRMLDEDRSLIQQQIDHTKEQINIARRDLSIAQSRGHFTRETQDAWAKRFDYLMSKLDSLYARYYGSSGAGSVPNETTLNRAYDELTRDKSPDSEGKIMTERGYERPSEHRTPYWMRLE